GVESRIACGITYASLMPRDGALCAGAACADTERAAAKARQTTRTRFMTYSGMRDIGGCLEEVAEFEVKFPAGRGASGHVDLVEAVAQVEPDRTEGRNDRDSHAGAAEQPGGIVLSRAGPHVAGVEEGADVERLRQPEADRAGHQEERVAERAGARLPARRVGIVSLRRNGELIVAAERDAELGAAHGEQLVEERRLAEHEPRPRGQSQHKLGRVGARRFAPQRAQGRVPGRLEVQLLEVAGAAEDPAALREPDGGHGAFGQKREIYPGVAQDGRAQGGPEAVVAAELGAERRIERRADEALVVQPVGEEEPGVPAVEHREAELDAAAPPPELAQVGDGVAVP